MSSSVQIGGLDGEILGDADLNFRRLAGTFGTALAVRFLGVAGNVDVLGESFGGAGTESGTGAAR